MGIAQVERVVGGAHGAAVALGGIEVYVALARDAAVVVVVAHNVKHGYGELAFFQRLGEALNRVSVLIPITVVGTVAAVKAIYGAVGTGFLDLFVETRHESLDKLPFIIEQVGKVYVGNSNESVIGIVHALKAEVVTLGGSGSLCQALPEMRHSPGGLNLGAGRNTHPHAALTLVGL